MTMRRKHIEGRHWKNILIFLSSTGKRLQRIFTGPWVLPSLWHEHDWLVRGYSKCVYQSVHLNIKNSKTNRISNTTHTKSVHNQVLETLHNFTTTTKLVVISIRHTNKNNSTHRHTKFIKKSVSDGSKTFSISTRNIITSLSFLFLFP